MALHHRVAVKDGERKEEESRQKKLQAGLVAAKAVTCSAVANIALAVASQIFLRSI